MSALVLLAASIALRNPFWPIGFEGPREAIGPEPKVAVKSASTNDLETTTAADAARLAADSDDDEESVSARHWLAARTSLRIGGLTVATAPDGTSRQSVVINGNIYGNGDVISVNHDGRRFTWQVQGLTEGKTLRLIRLRVRELSEDELNAQEKKKGHKK